MSVKTILLCAAAFLITSCGASKVASTAAGDVEVLVPCAGLEYFSSADFFRANAMGLSNNLEIANQKAMTAARAKLAAAVEVTVKSVTDNYISSYEDDQSEEARGRFQSLTNEVVNQKLNSTRVICNKTMQSAGGEYKSYVAIEISRDDISTAINAGVQSDSKLRTDFEYQRFREIFNQEMEKLAAENN